MVRRQSTETWAEVNKSELTGIEGGLALKGPYANAGAAIGMTVGYLGFGGIGAAIGIGIGGLIGGLLDWIF